MSEYPKVSETLSDPASDKLRQLADLFPAAVKDGELDLDALREELGDFPELQPGDERYELSWAGKQAAKKNAFAPLRGRTLTFDPEASQEPDTTGNLFIEGDNLEALKLLRQNYYGRVKMIYIDPPYNTGNDFVYKDKFSTSRRESDQAEGAVSEEGERLFKNDKSSNRFHANWLNMMYPRLRMAKDLLREDGVIFISIDDGEEGNLRSVCDEVFGEENRLDRGALVWVNKGSTKGFNKIVKNHEYIIAYGKNAVLVRSQYGKNFSSRLEDLEHYCFNKPNPGNPICDILFRSGLPIYGLDNIFFEGNVGDDVKLEILEGKMSFKDGFLAQDVTLRGAFPYRNQIEDFMSKMETNQPTLDNKGQRWVEIFFNKKGMPRYKKERNSKIISSVLDSSETPNYGSGDIKNLFGKKEIFPFPKPKELIAELLGFFTTETDIVVDLFPGSCTTAHAVMQLNAEDGGNRKHIMVQLPEACDEKSEAYKAGYKNIAEIGRERIRRAGEKIKEELRQKQAEAKEKDALGVMKEEGGNPYLENPDKLDVGFKAFRVADTNINWLKQDLSTGELTDLTLSDKDKLDFVPGFTDLDVVYEIMLRQAGIALTEPITPLTDCGPRTYLYGESYLICLEENVTKEMVEQLAKLEPTPLKFFFRDSAFGKDIALKDETFRRLSAEVAKHAGDQETYTVEFV